MTDPLTDAVKRLKQLQADVERLKAGQDEEGEPRVFFVQDESVDTSDAEDVRDSGAVDSTGVYNSRGYLLGGYNAVDILRFNASDATAASDSQTVRDRGIERPTYNSAFYSPSLLFRASAVESSVATDNQTALRSSNINSGTYNSSRYGTHGYNVVDILRVDQSDATSATDRQTDLRQKTVSATGAFGSGSYQTTAYN